MFLLVVALLCLAGCAPAVGVSPTGMHTITLRTADGDRTATVHRGASARVGAPLVVVLHGAGGTASDVRAHLGWDALADREGMMIAYPDGLDRTWNAGACCGPARDRGVDDVAFLDALVAVMRRDDGVDRVRRRRAGGGAPERGERGVQ